MFRSGSQDTFLYRDDLALFGAKDIAPVTIDDVFLRFLREILILESLVEFIE